MNKVRLGLLALVLAALWILSADSVMSPREELVWDKVRAAQQHLWQWRTAQGSAAVAADDPWQSGLIGLEWSGLTTTLGDLEAKRTAADPAWAVQYLRWFEQLGLQPGDPVSIYSSGSFPGLLLSALVAAESMELDIDLIVSLGSSTWGANHPDSPWPLMARELRRAGFVKKRADFYTLGGGGEMGRSLSPEGREILLNAAETVGVALLEADELTEMTANKLGRIRSHKSKLMISIGGSHANLGDDEAVLTLPPGLLMPSAVLSGGDGVIGRALEEDLPVLHMLNLKRLSTQVGIAFDSEPTKLAPTRGSLLWSFVGVLIFLVVLWRYRRWQVVADKN